ASSSYLLVRFRGRAVWSASHALSVGELKNLKRSALENGFKPFGHEPSDQAIELFLAGGPVAHLPVMDHAANITLFAHFDARQAMDPGPGRKMGNKRIAR